ncbi:hypothetical protein VbVaMValp1_33 [Vibrio phage Vb_VaM_Valp1]
MLSYAHTKVCDNQILPVTTCTRVPILTIYVNS